MRTSFRLQSVDKQSVQNVGSKLFVIFSLEYHTLAIGFDVNDAAEKAAGVCAYSYALCLELVTLSFCSFFAQKWSTCAYVSLVFVLAMGDHKQEPFLNKGR